MKKDLRLLAWYVCCPLYVLAAIWFSLSIIVGGLLYSIGLKCFAEQTVNVANAPTKWLDSIKS